MTGGGTRVSVGGVTRVSVAIMISIQNPETPVLSEGALSIRECGRVESYPTLCVPACFF
jgi:hypothetical protein